MRRPARAPPTRASLATDAQTSNADSADAKEPATTWPQRLRGWAVDLAIVIVVFTAISAWTERGMHPADESLAPQFILSNLDGNVVSLASLEGAVQVHFWATWCGVCARQHDELNSVASNLRDGESLVTIVVSSGDAEELAAYADEHELEFTILIDDGTVSDAYRVSSFPSDFYLNPSHEIVARDAGFSTRWGMTRRLRKAARS